MRRSFMLMLFAAGLCVPALAFGQGGEGEQPEQKVPEEAAAEGDTSPTEGEAPPAEGDGAATEGDDGPKVGPGGRPLREDYPGTEEAMRESMETDRIEGVASGEKSSKEVYDLRVKELETRIDDLKDRVFRSKSRIVLLKETLLGNKLAGSKALIVHKDELGRSFRLKRMTYRLDGNPIRNEMDRDGSLAEKETIELFNGAIGPGTHNLIVQLEYQGNSAVFNYFEGYTFKLEKACKFSIEEGMATLVDVVVFKKGGANTSIEERPALRCDISKTEIAISEERGADK